MNAIKNHRTTTGLAAATALTAALTVVSTVAPTAADAKRPDPTSGPTTQVVAGSNSTVDFAVELAQLKARLAQIHAASLGR
jgi:hypothetical protein